MRSEGPRPASDCWVAARDRGTRAESAHLASLPICWDSRSLITAMAASLHPERAPPARHTDDTGRAAIATFAPALTH